MKRYKAVIFDVDGTLLDTTEGVLAAVGYTIAEERLPQIDKKTLMTFIGPPVQESFSKIYGVDKEYAQKLATIFRNRYKDYELLKARPYEGIYHVMDEIRKMGIKIAVATYKRQDYAETILKYFHFEQYSDILYGADHENKLKKKDIIMLCMKAMEITDAVDVVMIGDSSHDAIGAKELGIDFIGVTYGFDFKTKEDVMRFPMVGYAKQPIEILNYI